MGQFSSEYLLLLAVVGDQRLRGLVDAELDRRAKATRGCRPYRQPPVPLKAA